MGEALAVLRPIANALDALHAAGVIHRDVKPANIFLAWEESGEVTPKLLDFGLIKLAAQSPVSTASDVLMGTPYYMSPEQCRGEAVDARSDVYALGVIAHELCTGVVPFSGESASAVLLDHVLKPPPKMSEVLPELPPALDGAVLAMLAKKPDDRPASAGAAFALPERAAAEAGITVPAGPLRLPRPSARPPADEQAPGQSGARANSVAPSERAASGIVRSRHASLLSWGLLVVGVAGGALLVSRLGSSGAEGEEAVAGAGALDEAEAVVPAKTAVPAAGNQAARPAAEATPAAERPGASAGTSTGTSTSASTSTSTSTSTSSGNSAGTVKLTVNGAPEGTLIKLGDRVLGPAPGPIELERGSTPLELTLQARGYEPRTLSLIPDGDATVDGVLDKLAPRRRQVSRDLENPF